MNARETMDQDGIIGRIVHHFTKPLHAGVRGHIARFIRIPLPWRDAYELERFRLDPGFFLLIGRSIPFAQAHDGADAVFRDVLLQTKQRQLAASIQNAFLDDVEVAVFLVVPALVADRSGDHQKGDQSSEDERQLVPHESASLPDGVGTSFVMYHLADFGKRWIGAGCFLDLAAEIADTWQWSPLAPVP